MDALIKKAAPGIFQLIICFRFFTIHQRSCLPGATRFEPGTGMQFPGRIHARLAAGRNPMAVERQSTDHEQFGGRRFIATISNYRVRLLPYHRNHIHTLPPKFDALQRAEERVGKKFVVVQLQISGLQSAG